MARMPRVVISGYPHHVTQRGNRRQKTFFYAKDYQYYLELMSEYTYQSGSDSFVKNLEFIYGKPLAPKETRSQAR